MASPRKNPAGGYFPRDYRAEYLARIARSGGRYEAPPGRFRDLRVQIPASTLETLWRVAERQGWTLSHAARVLIEHAAADLTPEVCGNYPVPASDLPKPTRIDPVIARIQSHADFVAEHNAAQQRFAKVGKR